MEIQNSSIYRDERKGWRNNRQSHFRGTYDASIARASVHSGAVSGLFLRTSRKSKRLRFVKLFLFNCDENEQESARKKREREREGERKKKTFSSSNRNFMQRHK